MPSLHARTRLSAESIFSRMSRLAAQRGAVNLGQGFPSTPPPAFLLEAARRAVGTVDQYSPPIGLPALREAVAQDLEVQPEQVVITCGATEAMFALAQTLYGPNPGGQPDELIAFEPVFDIYLPQTVMVGATFVGVPLNLSAEGWRLDIDALCRAVTPRTKALIVNSPFNPTGSVFTRAELQAIADLAREHDFWLISDEVYDELYYDVRPVSLRTLAPERTFTVGSAGKRLDATGWRVGWIVTPEGAAPEVAGLHQWTTFCAPAPLQAAVAEALGIARTSGFYDGLRRSYLKRMQLLAAGLRDLGAEVFTPQGTYFLTARLPGVDAERLVTEGGVAVIPLEAFYRTQPAPPEMLRLAFCKSEAEIEEALRRLKGFLSR
ncbi:aminotransferase class I/II-fold pyridoxal phosphate-dependent enzyme [Deinococcus rubellus]|uniref:Pyridoxal phosphate-dependent aminotransferase n=1 Tax=Deinococcus rubellus TaxID=1889240 RepID=A0ABY5YGA8_9DEIO|nr:pyridoxal phosphate-dependent aminotransferase [Deinococcus rubellus]UWX63201.1 pyridoxal phosphate-dependent aminotransferase [Deinococcus rubellus]